MFAFVRASTASCKSNPFAEADSDFFFRTTTSCFLNSLKDRVDTASASWFGTFRQKSAFNQ